MGLTVNISNRLLTHVHNKTSPIEQKAIKLWQFGEAPPPRRTIFIIQKTSEWQHSKKNCHCIRKQQYAWH